MLRIGIVEDDDDARATLHSHLQRYGDEHALTIDVRTFSDGSEIADSYSPDFDILFLDIEMPGLDGLATARRIREVDADVVLFFITEMPQYAIKGYEVAAFTYLLKPVPYASLAADLSRALKQVSTKDTGSVVFTVSGRAHRIAVSDILYIESLRHRIHVHTQGEQDVAFTGTIKAMEAELSGRGLVRCNNGLLVNLRHVTAIDQTECTLTDGTQLPVSRGRRKEFLVALTDALGGQQR